MPDDALINELKTLREDLRESEATAIRIAGRTIGSEHRRMTGLRDLLSAEIRELDRRIGGPEKKQ